MPTALIGPALTLGMGAAGQAKGGKGQDAATTVANKQFNMQDQLAQTGLQAWHPAANYFQTLLNGSPQAVAAAVGPTSDILKGQAQTASQQLANTTPGGGTAEAAQQQNQMNQYNQMSRLYAGVQPQAATALGGLSQVPMQLAAPNVGSGLKFNTHQNDQNMQSKGALGQGLGQMAGRGSQAGKNMKGSSMGSGSGSGG